MEDGKSENNWPMVAVHIFFHLVIFAGLFLVGCLVPMVVCIGLILWSQDLGGPLFLPMFGLVVVLGSGVFAGGLGLATAFTMYATNRWNVPMWVPMLVMFLGGALVVFSFGGHPLGPFIGGALGALLFTIHWWIVAKLSAMSFPRIEAVLTGSSLRGVV